MQVQVRIAHCHRCRDTLPLLYTVIRSFICIVKLRADWSPAGGARRVSQLKASLAVTSQLYSQSEAIAAVMSQPDSQSDGGRLVSGFV